MPALADDWASKYDWRKCEARINSYPHFLTEIDGLDFHFLHVRSKTFELTFLDPRVEAYAVTFG